jgi:alkanesulfonate monooxygenase SsuD/methylene tetrahydromethanopterin reductase-like flavin-dependent oxidoreductase (luciferase family)
VPNYVAEKMTNLKFGLAVENFTPAPRLPDLDAIVAYGRRAEELGYDSLWAWDHMFLGTGRRSRSWSH